MIHIAINAIAHQLNSYLKQRLELGEDIVFASNLSELDLPDAEPITNKIIISLVNVERDIITRPVAGSGMGGPGVQTGSTSRFNLYLMVAAHFARNSYSDALEALSASVDFFEYQPNLDRAATIELDPRIQRIVLEPMTLSFEELAKLWSVLGGKYLPSVLYKARMIVSPAPDVIGRPAPVREVNSVKPV